ncbi:hypothetical protein Tco_1116179 [Tanacetum coccineum]
MMKLTKPISSPGRTTTTTTNPPPLMKFLRNKSTSTRRRRASPISAPYRSTSLASKILCESSVEEEVKNLKIKKDDEDVNEGVKNGDEELMVIKRIEGIKEVPLFLTRCKSESGRKWDKFLV